MRRIVAIPENMSWEEFSEKYKRFFPISDDNKRNKKLKEEYKRLTGKTVDGKVERLGGKGKGSKRTGNGGTVAGSFEGQPETSRQP